MEGMTFFFICFLVIILKDFFATSPINITTSRFLNNLISSSKIGICNLIVSRVIVYSDLGSFTALVI